jgi:hypothetical protein
MSWAELFNPDVPDSQLKLKAEFSHEILVG